MSKKRKKRASIPQGLDLEAVRQEALEFAGIGLYRYTFDGTVLYADRGALKIFDLDRQFPDPASVAGHNISDLFVYTGVKGLLRNQIRRHGHVRGFEYPFRTLSGIDKCVMHDSYLVRDPDTGRESVQVIMFDVTARRRAEEQLRYVLAGARCILWHADVRELPDGEFDWDIHVTNEEAAQQILPFEKDAENAPDFDAWHRNVPPEDRERMDSISRRALRRGKSGYTQEYRCERPDGELRWLFEDTRIRKLEPKHWLVVGVCTDITERKRMEEALRVSEDHYRAIVEDQTELICRFKPDTTLTFVNEAYCRYFGRKREQLVGQSFLSLLPEDARERIRSELASVRTRKTTLSTEHTVVDAKGRPRWQQWTNRTIVDESGAVIEFQAVGRDITEQRLADARQRALSTGLRTVVAMADELISCPDLDALLRRAVEMARERLGIERCAIFMREGPDLKGSYGTDSRGQTTDERKHQFATSRMWLRRLRALRMNETRMIIITDQSLIEWKDGKECEIGRGWIAVTPIQSASEFLGVFCNDTAITHAEADETLQEIVTVYSSLLGAIIERKQAEDGLRRSQNELEQRVQERTAELTLANETLKETQRAQQAILDNIPDLAWLKDENGRFIATNEPFGQACGIPPEELVGKTDYDVWPRELAERYMADDREVIRSGRVKRVEEPLIDKFGQQIWIDTVKSPIVNDRGEIIGTTGIARDISEKKKVEEILRRSRDELERLIRERTTEIRRLAMAVEQEAEAVVIADIDGTIRYVNPAFERMTGHARDEVLGQNPRLLKSGKHDKAFYEAMWKTLAGGAVWSGRFTNRRKDGTLYETETTISPIRDDDDRIVNYVATSRDITREIQLEQQFQQAQKMEAVGRLAGGIAHDFNNLLTSILGYGRLIADELGEGNPMRTDVEEIIRAGDRAAALTKQLLAFSRKQMIQARPINLNAVVMDLDKLLRRTLGEDIELVTAIESGSVCIEADQGLIEQALMNLAVNARDAMQKGGTLTVETAALTFDDTVSPRHPGMPPGRYVMLSVRDTGTGMTEEVRQHCFEPFFTTKEMGKGTGLGLSIVYSVVKQFNGFMEIESAPGAGTLIRIYFPAIEAADYKPAVREGTILPRGTETVLVVEDEDTVRRLTLRMLESLGYETLEARHGGEAILICERHKTPIHLVLTDVVMPHIGGRDLVDRLLQIRSDFKVLYMSGFTDTSFVDRGIGEQSAPLMLKPFTQETLATKVRQVLDKR